MKHALSSMLNVYRQYRAAKARNKVYRVARYLVLSLVAGYILLLCFPQVLFAHQTNHRNFTVYSREPLDENIHALLESVDARLAASSINNPAVKPKLFFTNSYSLYSFISCYVGTQSFAKGMAALPTENVFINKTDVAHDLVFRNSQINNQRSLSGVMTHEVTHLLIRKKFGYWRNLTMPSWKKEGYAEYVAGGSTLDYETGVRMWKAKPGDGTGYQYFKYYLLVKYLLETRKLSVEDLFNQSFDMPALEAEVLGSV